MAARSAGLRLGVKAAAALIDVVRPPVPGVTVLIYHRVGGPSGLQVDLPTARFDEQLTVLRDRFSVVSLDDALMALAGDPPAGVKPMVVVTFDDGTVDFAEEALPVIERHGVPVTLYVATRFIDDQVPFPDDGRPLSWAALSDSTTTGLVEVGSHTHRHRLLDRLPAGEVADELDRSIDLIGAHIGRAPRHFAYPKAVPGSPTARAAIRERFASAALAGTRPNPFGTTDPYALARSPIQVSDGTRWFERKAAGGLAAEDSLRQVLNRRRYAGATS